MTNQQPIFDNILTGLLATCGVIVHGIVPLLGTIAVLLSVINGAINLWRIIHPKQPVTAVIVTSPAAAAAAVAAAGVEGD